MDFKKMKRQPLVSIVIVTYNSGDYIKECLDSIGEQTFSDFEIIVVDNGSSDDTLDVVERYPDITLIKNKINRGFCLANNQGIDISGGEYILTLNSDVALTKEFLLELTKDLDEKNVGMVGAKILNRSGEVIDSTGLVMSRFYRFFDRGRGEKDLNRHDNDLDIFGPCAAAALYKKEMLKEISYKDEYFDKDFFFLLEDFDIAWRARKKNWRAIYMPYAVCYHKRNSTNFNKDFRQYLSFRNRAFLLIKNADMGVKYLIVFLFYDLPRSLSMLCLNKYFFKSLREIMTAFSKMKAKRKSLFNENKV